MLTVCSEYTLPLTSANSLQYLHHDCQYCITSANNIRHWNVRRTSQQGS